jgi:hypothetical protein
MVVGIRLAPPDATTEGVGTPLCLPYGEAHCLVGTMNHQHRGALHQEEGGSPSPPMSIML